MSPFIYAGIADAILILHGFIAAYLATTFLFGTLAGRKIPTWLEAPLWPMIIIAIVGYIVLWDCPINPIERYFRELAGQDIYSGSFIVYYLKEMGVELNKSFIFMIELFTGLVIGILFFNCLTKKLDRTANQHR